jgi:hypothetical protein
LNFRPQCLDYSNQIDRTVLLCRKDVWQFNKAFFLGGIIWEPTRQHDYCDSKIQPSFPRPLCWNLSVNHHACQSTLPILIFELDENKMNFNFTAGFSNCGYHFWKLPSPATCSLVQIRRNLKAIILNEGLLCISLQIFLVYIHVSVDLFTRTSYFIT